MGCADGTALTTGPATPRPGPEPGLPTAVHMRTISPTAQIGPPNAALIPPAVIITDSAGAALAGVPVRYHAPTGRGRVSIRETLTNHEGVARPGTWSLSEDVGDDLVIVSTPGLAPVAFSARSDTAAAAHAGHGLYGAVAERSHTVLEGVIGAVLTLRGDGVVTSSGVTAPTCSFADCSAVTVNRRQGIHVRDGAAIVITWDDGAVEHGVMSGDSLRMEQHSGVRVYIPAPINQAAVIYERSAPHTWHAGHSRYVLRPATGRFELQYEIGGLPFFAYAGSYTRVAASISFTFDDSNTAGPWLADGAIAGDTLRVRYNAVMQLADFEDGSYIRKEYAR